MTRRKQAIPSQKSPSPKEIAAQEEPPVHPVSKERPVAKRSAEIAHFKAEFFEGPLPPPVTLAEYDRICPGAASRILAMAESQSKHRQELESRVVQSNCRSQDRGPVLGFVLALAVIALGGYLILHGKELSGLVALIGALTAVVIPFVYGKRAQRQELEEKRRALVPRADEKGWDYSLPERSSDGEP